MEALCFWTLLEHKVTQRFGNRISFHPQVRRVETPTLLVPLEELITITGQRMLPTELSP
jgi:hypothetical protein